jgi:hypothetical protein
MINPMNKQEAIRAIRTLFAIDAPGSTSKVDSVGTFYINVKEYTNKDVQTIVNQLVSNREMKCQINVATIAINYTIIQIDSHD